MNSGHHTYGETLLKIARLLFDEHVLSTVIAPTIADLQREIADAGPDRLKRVRAQWRGYRAFWTLALIAPFASWGLPPQQAGTVAFPDAVARLAAASILLALLALVGPALAVWMAVVLVSGILVAMVIHVWYKRHPSNLPTPTEPQRRSPQINFSSTEVAGNVGGLIFVVGSVFIVVIGLPSVIWFLFGATIAGCLVAWGLVTWHASHPKRGLPENRMVLR
jgi:hypothetical protein